MSSLLDRLKKRKLVQWLVVYAAVAWVVLQFTDLIGRQFQWPLVVQQSFTIALVFGFAIAAVVAWYHGDRGHQQVQRSEMLLIGVLVLAGGATIGVRYSHSSDGDAAVLGALADFLAPDPNKVLVIPFQVFEAAPTLEYLHEGMMDLVYSRLSGLGGLRAVNPRTTMAQLRGVLVEGQTDPEPAQTLTIAEALGAGFLILGEVAGSPELMSLSAYLLEVPGGRVMGSATVSGPQDSLTLLVNQLAVSALQARAGEDQFAIDASLPAVQAYLEGMQLLRSGRELESVEEFDVSLAHDSTLTAAAFGLLRAGRRLGGSYDARSRAGRLLVERRDQLSPRDARNLRVLRYESLDLAGHLENIQEAIDFEPELALTWFLLGHALVNDGPYIAGVDWAREARTALDRAELLWPGDAPTLNVRLRLHFATDDTVGLRDVWRRYGEDASGETFDFYRWRTAVALDDEDMLSEVRAGFADIPRQSAEGMVYQSILDGIPLDDAEAALSSVAPRAATDRERSMANYPRGHVFLAAGRLEEAGPILSFGSRSGVAGIGGLVFLFDDYDGAKSEFLEWLEQVVREQVGIVSDLGCQVSTIRGAMGDTVGLRALIAEFEGREDWRDDPCPALLGALIEAQEPGGSTAELERTDSIMRRGPIGVGAVNFLLAREFEAHGDFDKALSAIRRRDYNLSTGTTQPLLQFLRQEGRLAALAGDTTGAIAAYEHYLTLRTRPDPELQPEVERVRQALLALGGEPPGG